MMSAGSFHGTRTSGTAVVWPIVASMAVIAV
jgi:hypothetical protein